MLPSRVPMPRARRDRKRTVGLALATVASLFALLLLPGLARAQGDPMAGRDLYADTPGFSGQNFTGSCSNCHGTVQTLRVQRLGSTAWGDVSFDQAGTRLVSGINRIADMAQFRSLSQQQVEDLAAYIADVPRTSAATLPFVAPAVGSEVTQVITLRHAVSATAGQQLVVTGTRLGGAAATPSSTPVNGFNLVSNGCAGQTLNAAGTCSVSVRYQASAAPANVALDLQLRIGSTNFSRSVALQGSLAGAAPPPSGGAPAPGADSGGGGGALGLGWLIALVAAAFGLARRRA